MQRVSDTSAADSHVADLASGEQRPLHDSFTGVPPPADFDSFTSYSSNILDSELDDVVDFANIDALKEENAKIMKNIESSLEAFKKANTDYMQSEQSERLDHELMGDLAPLSTYKSVGDSDEPAIEELLQHISALQSEIQHASQQVTHSETLILTKEAENLQLRSRIASLEQSVHSKATNSTCHCTVF